MWPPTFGYLDGFLAVLRLFDLEADPYETNNLWKSPEALGTVYELWFKLDAWFDSLDWPPELFQDGKP